MFLSAKRPVKFYEKPFLVPDKAFLRGFIGGLIIGSEEV